MTILEINSPIEKKKVIEHVKSVDIGNEEEVNTANDTSICSCDSDNIDYDDEYISAAIELIGECSPSERAHLLECVGFIIGSYRDPNVASVSIKYDETLVSENDDSAIVAIALTFDDLYDREKAMMLSAMHLVVEQIRGGLKTSYIPFPKAEIDPHMFLMMEALQHGEKYAICFHE